jgi:hypothetical protein
MRDLQVRSIRYGYDRRSLRDEPKEIRDRVETVPAKIDGVEMLLTKTRSDMITTREAIFIAHRNCVRRNQRRELRRALMFGLVFSALVAASMCLLYLK